MLHTNLLPWPATSSCRPHERTPKNTRMTSKALLCRTQRAIRTAKLLGTENRRRRTDVSLRSSARGCCCSSSCRRATIGQTGSGIRAPSSDRLHQRTVEFDLRRGNVPGPAELLTSAAPAKSYRGALRPELRYLTRVLCRFRSCPLRDTNRGLILAHAELIASTAGPDMSSRRSAFSIWRN